MKNFLYCEAQEGGMQDFEFSSAQELEYLHCWMQEYWCRKKDQDLVDWLETAEIGECFAHRLGIAIRLKDK